MAHTRKTHLSKEEIFKANACSAGYTYMYVSSSAQVQVQQVRHYVTMAYRSSLDAKMSQSKCIGVWGMPYSQSVHCAWLPGTASMCPVEYVRYWFIEYDSSSSSFLYIVHTTYVCTCMLRAHVNVTCVSDLLITLYIAQVYVCTIYTIHYNPVQGQYRARTGFSL